ncbi:MAG: phosphatase PAP2 family protein [Algoriphagus sp.]|nr:phosphatase PAP2 family protein [Algoriphagus sp.]
MKARKKKLAILGNYFLVVLVLGLIFLPFYKKGVIELYINTHHHPYLDSFFSYVTHLGDGLILVVPIFLFLFHKYCYLVLISLASGIHLLLVHIGKKWLFEGMPRPAEFFKGVPFYEVPGVTLHHWGSFPSGHTATAFMLASFFYLVLPKKFKLHSILMGIALLVGMSRVYLMQHFLVDIWAGALIGVFSTGIGYLIVQKAFAKRKYQLQIFKNPLFVFKNLKKGHQ